MAFKRSSVRSRLSPPKFLNLINVIIDKVFCFLACAECLKENCSVRSLKADSPPYFRKSNACSTTSMPAPGLQAFSLKWRRHCLAPLHC